MANSITAVGIAVSDLARSAGFYGSVLGMKPLNAIKLDNMDEIVLGLDRGAAMVLMQYSDGVERDLRAFAGKLVFYVDDVSAVLGQVRAEGCAVTREPAPYPGLGTIGFAEDPDGYTLELIQRG
jgi:lactoylglutathione lyase